MHSGTLLCTLLDFADDAEADTRQATDLSDAGANVFQLFDDAVTLLFLVHNRVGSAVHFYQSNNFSSLCVVFSIKSARLAIVSIKGTLVATNG